MRCVCVCVCVCVFSALEFYTLSVADYFQLGLNTDKICTCLETDLDRLHMNQFRLNWFEVSV